MKFLYFLAVISVIWAALACSVHGEEESAGGFAATVVELPKAEEVASTSLTEVDVGRKDEGGELKRETRQFRGFGRGRGRFFGGGGFYRPRPFFGGGFYRPPPRPFFGGGFYRPPPPFYGGGFFRPPPPPFYGGGFFRPPPPPFYGGGFYG